MVNWYPENKKELEKELEKYIDNSQEKKQITGIIVPHAGYEYSGKIAGKAFSLIEKNKFNKAIVLGPSHQIGFYGIAKLSNIKTPLGKPEIIQSNIRELHGLDYEHSINNQIPFLQKLGINKILPIVIGQITQKDAKDIAQKILKITDKNTILIFSTDLSHFLPYKEAIENDKKTIQAIKNLKENELIKINNSACGIFPLLILIEICKIKNTKPKLIEYKNSGDITKEFSSVVGYASFVF